MNTNPRTHTPQADHLTRAIFQRHGMQLKLNHSRNLCALVLCSMALSGCASMDSITRSPAAPQVDAALGQSVRAARVAQTLNLQAGQDPLLPQDVPAAQALSRMARQSSAGSGAGRAGASGESGAGSGVSAGAGEGGLGQGTGR